MNRRILVLGCAIFCAALLCSQISFKLRELAVDEVVRRELAIWDGRAALPEFQNRILYPLLLKLAQWIAPELPGKSIWHAMRFASALVCFGGITWAIRRLTGSALRALLAVGFVAYCYLWTPMSHQWEHPSDFLDIFLIAVAVVLSLEGRWRLLLLVCLLGTTNRESAAFGGLVWLGVAAYRAKLSWRAWPQYLIGGAIVAAAAATVVVLRHVLGQAPPQPQQLGILNVLAGWRGLLLPFGPITMLVAVALPFVAVLPRLARCWSAEQRGLFAAAAASGAVTIIFGIVTELRVLLPSLTLLCLIIALHRPTDSDRDWLLAVSDLGPPDRQPPALGGGD